MKHNKEKATLDVYITNKAGDNRRRLLHGDLDLAPLEKMLGAPMSNKHIIAFITMQAALKTSMQLPDEEKFLIWTAHKERWAKLREGACAAMTKAESVAKYGDFSAEDVGLMEMYIGGKYGNHSYMNAQDHVLRILERMDEETVAAFIDEFDDRWQALKDGSFVTESAED